MKSLLDQKRALQERKLAVDTRIQAISLDLDKASAEFNLTGRGMSRERYFKLRTELATLKPESQRLQFELGDLGKQLRNGDRKTLGEHFISVAKLELSTDEFEKLLRLAIELRDGA
jgi:hypothetical protein